MFNFAPSAARAAGTMLIALVSVCGATSASAGTAVTTLNVSATVTANCTVTSSPLAFPNVNTLSGANVDGTGGLSISCTNGTPWSASSGVGAGTGASYGSRRMTAGANQLSYNLYTDAARSTVWGDDSGTTDLIGGTGTGLAQAVTIYGRVGLGQTSVPAGNYTDTVSVTVTY